MKNSMDAAKGLANYFDMDIESVLNRIDKNYNLIDLIEDLKIDLNYTYHPETLLNLKRMLEEETTLSTFLFSYGISINVSEKKFIYKNQVFPIYSYRKNNIEEEYKRCNSYDLYETNPTLKDGYYHKAMYFQENFRKTIGNFIKNSYAISDMGIIDNSLQQKIGG